MIIPDVNLLLYACDSGSPFHAAAALWWEKCLSGDEPVGLAPVVLFGFLRLGTHPRVFREPMTPAEAAGHVRSWQSQPVVQVIELGAGHVEKVMEFLEAAGTGGNLVTDAQIAACAMEWGGVVHTADAGFLRFRGVRWHDPITGRGSSRVRKS